MTYMEFVENKIKEHDLGAPVYTGHIAEKMAKEFNLPAKDASAAVSVAIKRLMNNRVNDLRFFQKGIYYRTKQTPFGEMGINKSALIADKYLEGDNGYETGLSVLHRMGLTTQVPAEIVIASNKSSGCIRKDKILGVSVCPPKIPITTRNKQYLQTLDVIEYLIKAPIDAEHPFRILAKHIERNKLDYAYLLAIASKNYNKNTVLTLGRIAGEEINEITSGQNHI